MKLIKLPSPKPDKPELLGMRGATNDGLEVIFDKPVRLNPDEPAGYIWRIKWECLGQAILHTYEEKPE